MAETPDAPSALDAPPATSDGEFLRQFLASRDIACPQCDYNLRNLPGTRCPECGEELVLRLQLEEPRQAAALAGLIALAAGAGMNFLLLGFIGLEYLRNPGWGKEEWKFVYVNGGGLLVLSTCIVLWLRSWRKIRRLGPVQRWALAAAAALLSLADLLVFAKYIS